MGRESSWCYVVLPNLMLQFFSQEQGKELEARESGRSPASQGRTPSTLSSPFLTSHTLPGTLFPGALRMGSPGGLTQLGDAPDLPSPRWLLSILGLTPKPTETGIYCPMGVTSHRCLPRLPSHLPTRPFPHLRISTYNLGLS